MIYKVLSGCSVRLSPDETSPDFHRFQDWLPGETLDTDEAPEHLDVSGLLTLGVIEEFAAPGSKGAKGPSRLQDAQEPSQEPGAVLTDGDYAGAMHRGILPNAEEGSSDEK